MRVKVVFTIVAILSLLILISLPNEQQAITHSSIARDDIQTLEQQDKKTHQGSNLNDCVEKIATGGWCEIVTNPTHPSISSVWPKNIDKRTYMRVGPRSVLTAWNSAAIDEQLAIMYFMGGGHADYGGNEVYQFNLISGKWSRLTEQSPLTRLFVARDYTKGNRPWRSLCWRPDGTEIPGSAHTYDGIIFSEVTRTIFYFFAGAANGSCFQDKDDEYRDSSVVVNKDEGNGFGWYEFNPSQSEHRHQLAPLTWRKRITKKTLTKLGLGKGYPRTAQIDDGRLIVGTSTQTIVIDPLRPDLASNKRFTKQADFGDGTMIFDRKRQLLWSIHRRYLLGFDLQTQKLVHRIAHHAVLKSPSGKSIAIDNSGRLFSWNGIGQISILNPTAIKAGWQVIDWKDNGPQLGTNKVYGKWVYLSKYDAFAGISTHKTGFWIYKHPKNLADFALEIKNN